jgi:hypothetical protein
MASWAYASTDLLTGQALSDSVPLNVQSFGTSLNGTGTMTASLNLSEAYASNAPFVAALQARRAVVWALADGQPAWCGLVTDWPDMSREQGNLPVTAQTLDWIFSKRLITDTIEYAGIDLYAAFTDLARYGLTKRSGYIASTSPPATRPAAYLAMVASQGRIARLSIPSGLTSGATWTASYAYSDFAQVSSAWSDMCASGNLEYWIQPGFDSSGELAASLRLGYTQLGRPVAETGFVLSYPGNVTDYGYTITGSQSANLVWATAPPNGSALTWTSVYPSGADSADLASAPLFEATASWQGSVVTTQAQVNNWANGQVALATAGMTNPVVNVGGGAWPSVTDLQLGDAVQLAFTSPLHPAQANGAPGLQQEVRITAITVYPPGPSQSEYLQLTTSAVIA